MIEMPFISRIAPIPILLFSVICAPAVRSQTVDDAFFDWDLECYRLLRAPDDPSGAILPLPSVTAVTEGSPLYSSTRIETADITQPEAIEEESDGLRLPDGLRARLGVGKVISLQGSLRIQLGGRFMTERRGATRGEWLDRSVYWVGDHLEIRAGLTRSFWGDGNEGSLLLGRTAPPLEMIRVRSVRPARVPWLGEAGRFHGSIFLGYLDDGARTIPDPLLNGARLEWEPTGWARLSLARTILFGGAGRTEKLNLRDVWNILLARNENRKDSRDYRDSDQLASFGLELRLPRGLRSSKGGLLEGCRAFYEYGGEDGFHGLLPRAPAHHYGLSLASHGWIGLVEFSDTMNRANHWYTHWTYGEEAYFYRGYCIGHPMGSLAWSRHIRFFSPTWETVRAQVWWRLRDHESESGIDLGREGSLGVMLRHDLDSKRVLEAEFEGYRETGRATPRREPPVRWRGSIGVHVGASASPVGAP